MTRYKALKLHLGHYSLRIQEVDIKKKKRKSRNTLTYATKHSTASDATFIF